MTINAEFIHDRCDGTTKEELASRSKMLRHGLRRLRSLERDVVNGNCTPARLQRAWSQLIETSSRVYRQDFQLKPDISELEQELGYLDESVELQLPWHKHAAFAFHHHCHIEIHGEVIDMGTYHVDVVTQQTRNQPYVYVTPLKDCLCGYTGTLHPHISDGTLCMGELRNHMYNAWNERNIQAIIDMIRATLDNYNPGSPYQSIDKWFDEDVICTKCGRQMDPDQELTRYHPRTINPHGMPRDLRGAWDNFLTFDYRSEWHPFHGKHIHRGRNRLFNYPEGTFRNITICNSCFKELKDHVFRHALRQAVVNHDYEVRIRRNQSRDRN